MNNEILLLIELLLVYGTVLLFYRFFGTGGLCAAMVLVSVLANIEVLVLVDAFGMKQTLGNVLFASTFLVTDILSENHGKELASRTVNIGIAVSAAFVLLSSFWLLYTPAAEDAFFPHIQAVFSGTPRIVLASLVAYAVCQKLDVWLYHRLWSFTSRRGDRKSFLWLRNNGATLAAQLVNTVLFNVLAFAGIYELPVLLSVIAAGYCIFVFTSLVDTPFLYLARRLKKAEQKPLT